jgi:crotonobetainyl-CoA:carnitine CoA-transferase CaiB-like acyl-CoA transferase
MDDRHWRRFCTALGRPELIQDPRFASEDARFANQAEIEAELNPSFADGTRDEWVERLRRERVPCAAERTVAEVLADPSLRSRGMLYPRSVGGVEMTHVAIPFHPATPD